MKSEIRKNEIKRYNKHVRASFKINIYNLNYYDLNDGVI